MSVEAKVENTPEVTAESMEARTFCQRVTSDMIILDLAHGLTRDGIANKYKFKDMNTGEIVPMERWMVDVMFKDPSLKGRKTSKVRKLAFEFSPTPVVTEEAKAPVIAAATPSVEEVPNEVVAQQAAEEEEFTTMVPTDEQEGPTTHNLN